MQNEIRMPHARCTRAEMMHSWPKSSSRACERAEEEEEEERRGFHGDVEDNGYC